MKTNLIAGKSNSPLILFIVCIFFSGVLITGCKKDNTVTSQSVTEPLPQANLVPDEDETEYTMANYQDALDNVEYDGDKLIFQNLSHFFTVATALDSIGDSTANVWFQDIGFTNSLYVQYKSSIDNMPEDLEDADMDAYYTTHSNSLVYDGDLDAWHVNAQAPFCAKLLNGAHKAKIGGNIYYSNYDVDVMVSQADESLIPTYVAQGTEQNDEYAIVKFNRTAFTTSGPLCLGCGQTYYFGEINCGSPVQKRAKMWMKVFCFTGLNGATFTGAHVIVQQHKRGFMGRWYKEARGSQVGGMFGTIFNMKYFNMAFIYSQSSWEHVYPVFSNQGVMNVCVSDLQICVAPMCSGNTICQNYW
jgi:hypothetical protein